jgi:hypothetical protein
MGSPPITTANDSQRRDAPRHVESGERGQQLWMRRHGGLPDGQRVTRQPQRQPGGAEQYEGAEDDDLACAVAVCHGDQPVGKQATVEMRIERAQQEVERRPDGAMMIS